MTTIWWESWCWITWLSHSPIPGDHSLHPARACVQLVHNCTIFLSSLEIDDDECRGPSRKNIQLGKYIERNHQIDQLVYFFSSKVWTHLMYPSMLQYAKSWSVSFKNRTIFSQFSLKCIFSCKSQNFVKSAIVIIFGIPFDLYSFCCRTCPPHNRTLPSNKARSSCDRCPQQMSVREFLISKLLNKFQKMSLTTLLYDPRHGITWSSPWE